MRNLILVDYENVHNSGLDGAELLSEEDKIIIFESDVCKLTQEKLPETKAAVNIEHCINGYPNSMDIRIIGKFFSCYSPDVDIYIISKDRDFTMLTPIQQALKMRPIFVVKTVGMVCKRSRLMELMKQRDELEDQIDRLNAELKNEAVEVCFPGLANILKQNNITLSVSMQKNLQKHLIRANDFDDFIKYLDTVIYNSSNTVGSDARIAYSQIRAIVDKVWMLKFAA